MCLFGMRELAENSINQKIEKNYCFIYHLDVIMIFIAI